MQQSKERDNQLGHTSPDLVLLHTDDVPSNYPGTRHLWTMRAQQDGSAAEGGENNTFLEHSIIQGTGTEGVGDFNSNSDCLSLGAASCHQPQRRLP